MNRLLVLTHLLAGRSGTSYFVTVRAGPSFYQHTTWTRQNYWVCWDCSHIHTYTHLHHTQMHVHVHTQLNAICSLTHTHTHTYIHTYIHTHTHIHTYIHTHILTGDRIAILSNGSLICCGSFEFLRGHFGRGHKLTLVTLSHSSRQLSTYSSIPTVTMETEDTDHAHSASYLPEAGTGEERTKRVTHFIQVSGIKLCMKWEHSLLVKLSLSYKEG